MEKEEMKKLLKDSAFWICPYDKELVSINIDRTADKILKNLPQAVVSGNGGNQILSDKKVAEVALHFAEWINKHQWDSSETDEYGWQRVATIDERGKLHYQYSTTEVLYELFHNEAKMLVIG